MFRSSFSYFQNKMSQNSDKASKDPRVYRYSSLFVCLEHESKVLLYILKTTCLSLSSFRR